MARNVIPMKDLPSFTEEVVLEGIPYVLKFNWNSRGEFWTIDFYDVEQSPLLYGLKMVSTYELINWYPDRGLPPGYLFVVDPGVDPESTEQQSYVRPDRSSFINESFFLVYIDSE